MRSKFKETARFEAIRLVAIIIVLLPITAFVLGYFVFWVPMSQVSIWLASLLPIGATVLLSIIAYKLLTSRLFEPLYERGAHNLGKPADANTEDRDSSVFGRMLRGRRRGPRR